MKVLVLAERDGQALKASTYQAVAAATAWNLPIDLLVYGADNQTVAQEAATLSGVQRVLNAQAAHLEHPLVEDLAELVLGVAQDYAVIVSAHSVIGKSLLPSVAARLDIAPTTDVVEIHAPSTYVRPSYAGNIFTRIENHDPIQMVSVRTTAFQRASINPHDRADITPIEVPAARRVSRWIKETLNHSERPELSTARVVIAGGRSLGAEFDALLNPLAEQLDAAIGATRACVDAGFAANDLQVGQTGTIIAPELYIAVGVSGAVQHIAGIKDSKIIVAINHDPDAPIFKYADYGLVADLFTALPALHSALNSALQEHEELVV